MNKKYIFLPEENKEEGSVIPGITLIPLRHLQEAVDILIGKTPITHFPENTLHPKVHISHQGGVDFSQIHGQEHAKRALMIAAAG